jgi:hypothetical protein
MAGYVVKPGQIPYASASINRAAPMQSISVISCTDQSGQSASVISGGGV